MKMGMCMHAVRLGGLPIQCLGMAKGLAMPLSINSSIREKRISGMAETAKITLWTA